MSTLGRTSRSKAPTLAALALALSLVMAACSGAEEPATGGAETGADGGDADAATDGDAGTATAGEAAGGEEVTIRLQEWNEYPDTPLQTVVEGFMEQNPDVNVEVLPQIPFGEEYDTRMRTQLAAGNAPTIFRMNDDFLQSFSSEGVLKDLTPYVENLNPEEYVQPLFEFGRQPDGTYTGWTVGVQPRVIYYNVDMFEEAGVELPPQEYTDEGWMWEDFLETAQALTVPGERWGATVYTDTGYEQAWSRNNGSETGIFSEDGRTFTLVEPEAAEGLQWAVDLTCVHEVQPPWVEVQEEDDDIALFAAQRIGMMEGTFSATAQLRNVVSDFTWDVTPIPGNVNQFNEGSLYLYIIAESASQEEADAAWRLLEYMGSEEGSGTFASAEYFIPVNVAGGEQLSAEEGELPANVDLFAEAAEFTTLPNFPPENASLARQIYRPALDEAYNCERPVRDVLLDVEDQVNEALAG